MRFNNEFIPHPFAQIKEIDEYSMAADDLHLAAISHINDMDVSRIHQGALIRNSWE